MSHSSTSPVFSLYYIAIDTEAGITRQAFETFVQSKGVHIPCYPGWRWTLLRGLRGERAGQYLMLFEIENAQMRDRYVAADGNQTEQAREFWALHPEAAALLAMDLAERPARRASEPVLNAVRSRECRKLRALH